MAQQTALYRHFDAAGILLYVGISSDPVRRLRQHERMSAWGDKIASITVQRFSTRQKAEAAERHAVKTEKPLHNVVRFKLPLRVSATERMSRTDVLRLIDHFNASGADPSTVEGCAARLNISGRALRAMLYRPHGHVITLSVEDQMELMRRVCRGSGETDPPLVADCLLDMFKPADRRRIRQGRERLNAKHYGTTRHGRPARRTAEAAR